MPLFVPCAPYSRIPFLPLASWWTPTHPPKPSPEVVSSGKPSLVLLNRVYLPPTPPSHCLTGDAATFALCGHFFTHVLPTLVTCDLGTKTVPLLYLFITKPSRGSDMWEGFQCMFAEQNESPVLETRPTEAPTPLGPLLPVAWCHSLCLFHCSYFFLRFYLFTLQREGR